MGIIEEFKEVVKLAQKLDNMELYRKILDLQAEIIRVVEENMQLKAQVKELSKKLTIQETLEFKEEAYWRKLEDGTEDGPFCTSCWDSEQKLIRMIVFKKSGQPKGCPVCHTVKGVEGIGSFGMAEIKFALGERGKD